MAGRKHHSGYNPDLFGHNSRRRRRRVNVSPPAMTRDQAMRISQGLGYLGTPALPQTPSHVNDDADWEEIADIVDVDNLQGHDNEFSPDDPSANRYAQHQKELRYANTREQRAKKWSALRNTLLATFLHLQYQTRNWTTKQSYLSEDIECQFSPEKQRQRSVDLIDMLGKYLLLFLLSRLSTVLLII